MLRVGVIGCSGRMGKAVITETLHNPQCTLSGGLVRQQSSHFGADLGTLAKEEPTGILAGSEATDLFTNCDAVIDFSDPGNTLSMLSYINVNPNLIYIIGTTGFTGSQEETIHQHASQHTIIYSANMSIGVNLLLGLTQQLSSALDDQYDIEIIEAHHNQKVDAPSGTALELGLAAAAGRGIQLDQHATKTRDGIIGPRPQGSIGFSTVRAGDIVGEHTVMFATKGERIELTHKCSDRGVFAKGAIRAGLWAQKNQKPAGLYTMKDVLFSA